MMGIDLLPSGNLPVPLHIYVVSNTPGRLRFRIAPQHRQLETMAEIASTLKSFFSQVQRVRTRPQTGSITVFYTGDTDSFGEAMMSLEQFGMIVIDRPTGQSKASTKVSSVMARANQWLEFNTEGAVDLRFLVPLLFGLLALRQAFAKSPGLNTAPWYVLAWYAFDSFIKLNQELPAISSISTRENRK
jgi:hypothetical protein